MSRYRNSNSRICDFPTVLKSETEGFLLRFLYRTWIGRSLLWILIRPWVSKLVGSFLNLKVSRWFVPRFIRKNQIAMERYFESYESFNEFFSRPLKVQPRLSKLDFIAPCDGKLSIFPTKEIRNISLKHSSYHLSDLLGNSDLEARYEEGYCLVFRLTPDDYHRYHFLDDGKIVKQVSIPGVLHTVRPIAMANYPVYFLNQREVTVMETKHFGVVTQVEIGALCVGKICNHSVSNFKKGEEKGKFLFGGSTILLFLEKNVVDLNETLIFNTKANKETIVCFGDVLGRKR